MRITFTLHVEQKLQTQEAKELKITKGKLIAALRHPLAINKDLNLHRSIGKLNRTLSLAVIWKIENGIIKVITFYPAERGRYERKLL